MRKVQIQPLTSKPSPGMRHPLGLLLRHPHLVPRRPRRQTPGAPPGGPPPTPEPGRPHHLSAPLRRLLAAARRLARPPRSPGRAVVLQGEHAQLPDVGGGGPLDAQRDRDGRALPGATADVRVSTGAEEEGEVRG